ncbi:MAG: hypothetical protein Q7S29_03650 [Candidatus Peribacter sp.]|nr:hypothetical protein [Candidatus Peribacter sp.]
MSGQALTALGAAIAAALEAAAQDLEVLVAKMREVDAAFTVAEQQEGEEAVRLLVRVAVAPQGWSPEILGKLDFASSLVSMERPFFVRAMEIVVENAQSLEPQQIVSAIGACRRHKGYTSMRRFNDVLRLRLTGDDSPGAYGWRAKADYELHMAAYQKAETLKGSDAQAQYQTSRDLAEQSAAAAQRAGDPCGRLFALMNVSGLILPKMGRWEEGLRLSERVSTEAEALAADAPDDEAKKRPLRVAMNCYLHRIDMLVQNGGRKGAVEALLAKLNGNPIYQACCEHADVAALVQRAQRYVKV